MAKFSALLASLTLVASSAEERSSFLSDVYSGKVPKSKVEVVLAQHEEDIAWSNPLSSVRTVYCKGSHCDADAIQLPNVGREGHTFLHHIVNNYDSLSDWTVFSQAEKPTDGYIDHKRGGGHLLSGSSFEDYLMHQDGDDSRFLMTSKVHLPSLRHALRSSFKINQLQTAAKIHSKSAVCPKDEGEDVWGSYRQVPQLRNFLERKCGVEENVLGDALRTFWEDFVQLPMPAGEVVHYSQGARFAVSRARVQQRSKAYYQQLLDAVSMDADPCLNYLFEFSWYYIVGAPAQAPCASSREDFEAGALEGRLLQEGVSGEGGGVSDGEDEGKEPAALQQIMGTMDIQVRAEDAANITENETMKASVADGIGDALDIDAGWIDVTFEVSGSSRRLDTATSTIVVTYTITLPEDTTTSADTLVTKITDSATTTALTSAISSSTGVPVTVANVATPTQATQTQTSTTTTTQYVNPGTSGSLRSVLSSLLAVAIAALLV